VPVGHRPWADAAGDAGSGADALRIYEELRPLFFPRSAAVVGVSQDTWKPGSSMLRALIRFGFSGPLYPVSGRGGQLMGLDVHLSIASLPEAPETVFLFVPTEALIGVVRQCRDKGVKAIVAFTGGFGETGTSEGKALEEQLKEERRKLPHGRPKLPGGLLSGGWGDAASR
jgi:acyl-CoA synthetase (NDP forming)